MFNLSLKNDFIFAILILVFVLVGLPVYSEDNAIKTEATSKEQSSKPVDLPSFRHHKHHIEVEQVDTIDLLLHPDTKTITIEANDINNNKIGVDKKSGSLIGLEVFPVRKLKIGKKRD